MLTKLKTLKKAEKEKIKKMLEERQKKKDEELLSTRSFFGQGENYYSLDMGSLYKLENEIRMRRFNMALDYLKYHSCIAVDILDDGIEIPITNVCLTNQFHVFTTIEDKFYALCANDGICQVSRNPSKLMDGERVIKVRMISPYNI